jgi:hypothetical protein
LFHEQGWGTAEHCTLYILSAVVLNLAADYHSVKNPPELKTNENSTQKNKKNKNMLTLEPKTFQDKHLCLLLLSKIDGNAVAHSILPISKLVRKQGPLILKISATSFSDIFESNQY